MEGMDRNVKLWKDTDYIKFYDKFLFTEVTSPKNQMSLI